MRRVRLLSTATPLVLALALAGCRSTGALAPPPHPAPDPADVPRAFEPDEAPLVVWFAGLERALAHPKDAGLARAFDGLDERLAELFTHDLREDVPEEAWRLPWEIVSGPWALRVRIEPTRGPGVLPLSAQLDVPTEDAERLSERAARLIALTGMPAPEPDANGRRSLPLPVPASLGPFEDHFALAVGGPPRSARGGVTLPAGYTPTCALRLDFGAFLDLLGEFAPMMGPDGEQMMELFEAFGLERAAVEAAAGSGPNGSILTVRWLEYAEILEATSGDPGTRIGADTLRLVPDDAVYVSAGVVDLAGMLDTVLSFVRMSAGEQDPFGGQDPLEMLATMCGVHLSDDLLAELGPEFVVYAADSTGGGGLASLTMLVRVRDPEVVDGSLERLERFLNGLAAAEAEGRVELRHWDHRGQDYGSLTFPGLPVPFEPTWARVGDWLIQGLTPQAVIAAVEHIRNEGPSLLENPRFAAAAPKRLDDLMMVEFLDTPTLLSEGYGWSTLLSTAITNGLRSPRDSNAGPGVVLPPVDELRAGARGTLTVARMVDRDLVSVTVGDPSVLVGLTGFLGALDRMPVIAALPLLAAGGVMTARAQSAALEVEMQHAERRREARAALEALGYVGEDDDAPIPAPDDDDR